MCPECTRSKYIEDFELDHITPRSKGGLDIDDNIQLICGWCNGIKGNRSMEYLRNYHRQRAADGQLEGVA